MPLEIHGAPINRRLLEDFSGNHLEGFLLSISSNDLVKLESSVNFLEIVSKDSSNIFLKSKLKPIKIPNSCYPVYSDNDVGVATASDNAYQQSSDTKCYHSNRFFDEGEQWYSSTESCTLCACNNRRVKCDSIKCPPLKCKKEEQLQKKGDCCPTCLSKLLFKNTNITDRVIEILKTLSFDNLPYKGYTNIKSVIGHISSGGRQG